MRILFSLLLICTIFTSFTPGSGTAYLKCRSESGRTLFYAELQDITGGLESAVFTIDGTKLTFTPEDEAHTVFAPNDGIFTIIMEGGKTGDFSDYKFIRF